MTLNVVGSEGGKVIIPSEADGVVKAFARWTRSCDFYDSSITYNEILKLCLITRLLNGDMIALYDDGLITDSGRLLLFEGDEIGNTSEEAIRTHYGPGAHQSNGLVYDAYSRMVGAVVSRSQRGQETMDPDKCFYLHRDPEESPLESSWYYLANRWRPNQGRGTPPLASTLGGIEDAEMLKNYELQSSKRNAQLLLQILQDPTHEEETSLPSTFGDADLDSMTDDEIKALVEKEVQPQVVNLERLSAANAQAQVMVPGVRAEVLDSKRPNPNVQAFLDYLTLRSYTPWGIPEEFASGKPGANFKQNQIFAERAFEEQQKCLEQFADWSFRRWHDWSVKHGAITPLAEEQLENISWSWPHQMELDPVAKANAQRLQLEAGLITYEEIFGNGYRDKLAKIKEDLELSKQMGFPHPALKLISGGESKLLEAPTTQG